MIILHMSAEQSPLRNTIDRELCVCQAFWSCCGRWTTHHILSAGDITNKCEITFLLLLYSMWNWLFCNNFICITDQPTKFTENFHISIYYGWFLELVLFWFRIMCFRGIPSLTLVLTAINLSWCRECIVGKASLFLH